MRFRALVVIGETVFGVNYCYSTLYRSITSTIGGNPRLIENLKFYDLPQKLISPGNLRFTNDDIAQVKTLETKAVPGTTTEICTILKQLYDKRT